MAEAGAPPHVDVLIVTALKEEYDAVLRVDTGAWRKSTWKEERDALGLERAFRTFQAAHGGALRVLVTRAPDMGEEAAASTVAPLINTYQPRCLAMCGVCAGRKGVVELGDVVIADLLWNYERGKLERTGAGKGAPRVKRRNISYQLRPDWEQRAPSFQPDRGSPWLTERPRPYSAQMDWLLERLLLEEDPAQHPQRTQLCSDYAHVLDRLRERRWIYSKGPPRLTKRGEQYIRQLRGDHPDGLPEPKPFRVHVGPIATGCKVIKDPEIFETLAETDYKVLGLEMEASAIGALAHRHQLDMLVMKGVMDFADLAKNDNFKPFAARASAECLLAFLREHLPAGTVAPSRKEPPDPQALAEALAKYKQARAEDSNIRQLNLQGLAGIAQGPHRTELDLLDFAVAPSLHDAAEGEGGEEASLRQQLNARDLEPARQKELEERLLRLQHERWAHHGGRKHPVISFAKAIRHHRRFVIIGDPGAGKSVLTRLALLACTEGAAGDQARLLLMGNDQYDREVTQALSSLGELLPVRLSLGGLGQRLAEEQLSLAECIRQELSHQRAPEVLLDSLGELLTAGRLFLILDGLDEVPDRQRKRVADAVAALARDYPDVRLVATSRPNGYHPRIQHFDYTRLAPLHESQQHALVWRLHRLVETHRQGDEQAVEHARRRTHALLHAIKTREEWRELSSNPLLLTLCALTSANEEGLPKHRVILFENFIRTLLVEWRAMELPEAEDPLLKAWSSVASTLVQQEKRQGVMEGYLLRLLDEALGGEEAPALVTAETALRLAIETGLVRKDEETVAFWHSSFAEFLAACALTSNKGRGAAKRLLEAEHLPPLVLQFAAARLEHVLQATDEVDALAEGLLERDEEGAGRLLRPGLRAVSACMSDGVAFSRELVLQVWSTWTGLIDTTPPSPLWEEFGRLTERAPRPRLPKSLVKRLALIDDRNIEEVQRARARLIAPSVGSERSAIEVCERWLKHPTDTTLRLYGALGLASAGTWTDAVIDALGRFGATHWELSPGDVGRVVRQAAPAERERLRELVRMRPTPDEHAPRDLQISAACLLAVGGAWNEEVAQVVKLTLADRPSTQRTDEAKAVVRYCAREAAVQGALLDWMGDDSSSLGSFAREIVEDVAPLIKDLPAAVLKRTTSAEGSTREKLESLLVSIGMERTTLIETLRAWVVSPQLAQEQKRCAASILLGLAPGDDQLHEALQHGMRQPDSMERVHWAQLALGHGRELSDAALAALQSCARSPEQAVRKLVYTGMHVSRSWLLEQQPPTRWLACAADREVPAAARLEAVEFLAGSPALRARLEPVLRELLDTDDPAVRVGALKRLSSLGRLDAHAATLAAEEIARTGNETALRVLLRDCPPSLFTPGLLQAYLRALPLEDPSTSSEERCEHLSRWHSRLAELASRDLSCLESLLDALGRPGQAGAAVTDTLSFMLPPKNLPVRDAFRERLSREARGSDPVALRRLVYLCVRDEETRHAAIEASRALDLNSLSQWRLGWLALRMDADAPEDALRLWLRVLEGDDLELILQAATRLFHRYPEKARAWLPPALSRLLASSNPSNRLDAGSLALELGILEEKAHTALLSCLDPVGQEYATKWNTSFSLDEYRYPVEPPRDGDPLKQPLLFRRGRVDFMAMHVLCHYRPDIGLPRLAEWLKDQEWERFSCAARLLAKRRDFRESVRVTLEHRLGSAPGTQLEHIMGLVEKCGLFSTAMVSQVIARHGAEDPSFSDVDQCLQWCLRAHPEIWALIRSQDPARRADFAHLIDRGVRINADTIAFAVELAFAHIHPSEVVSKLRSWCRTPQGEVVRGWLRQALEAQALPSDIPSLFLFDNLAAMGELPAERRIGVLRRVLDIELPAPEEEGRSSLLEQQTTAGLRLLELGGHDERIASILEAAVYELQGLYNEELFQFASALLTLRPVDEALRKRLVKRVIRPWFSNSLAQELQVLEQQAGLSRPELIDVLIARLQALAPDTSSEIPTLLEALERLGCEQERRTTLLLELVSQRGATLPVYMRLTLAGRSELPASDAAKLLLSVIAESGWDVREAARLWLERFATRRAKPADEKLRLHHADSRYLSHRLQLLETLSPVDERAWLEQLLAELVGTPTDRVLALYRRARGDDPSLSPQEWTQLMDWLTLQPGDARTTQLGKQWLMLGLWQAQEPSTVTAVLNS